MNDTKSNIDKKRDSARTVQVGDPGDDTPIRLMIPTSRGLYTIKDQAIYLTRLADDIDPERTNIDVPDTHQRVSDHGFNSDIVGKILITARTLFEKGSFLSKDFDKDKAVLLSIDATIILCEIEDISKEISSEIENIVNTGLAPYAGKSQNIPRIKNLETRTENFIRKIDELRQVIIDLFKIAFPIPERKSIIQDLRAAIVDKHGEQDPMVIFFDQITPSLKFSRNLRNAFEHPDEDKNVIIKNFNLMPDNVVQTPTIELVGTDTPQPEMPIKIFMNQFLNGVADTIEITMVNVCGSSMTKTFAGMESGIVELPEDRRMHKKSRFGYGINFKGNWQPIG